MELFMCAVVALGAIVVVASWFGTRASQCERAMDREEVTINIWGPIVDHPNLERIARTIADELAKRKKQPEIE